jgi:SAM-dependent MidA family methyltransferase
MPAADTARSSELQRRLIEIIRRDGPMPIDLFTQTCLADPVDGYWQRPATIGARGDFITAPEISQVFGELIGLWCAVAWAAMGQPAPVRLIELGPGRGTLMADIQRTIARAMPALHKAVEVHLVEASRPMREAQAERLAAITAKPPSWHPSLGDVPDGPAIVIANEFLDALPIRQFVFDAGAWHERVVTCTAGGELAFALGARVGDSLPGTARQGDVLELRPLEDSLLDQLAMRAGPLASLFIDYGPADAAYGDTLQSMRNHAYVDPLVAPGASDLTAHVQFATFAKKARSRGLGVDGPITQAEFLGALGHATRTSRLMSANPAEAGAIEAAAQRLVAPTGMGTLFKVLCVRSPTLPAQAPFA